MIVVGVDENGLGPRLGPLVATAVALELRAYDRPRLRRAGLRVGVQDSKQSSAFGKMAHAESVALALVERVASQVPRDADELLELVSLDDPSTLRSPCPKRSEGQCWGHRVLLPAFGGDVAQGRRLLSRLERSGLRIHRARTVLTCSRLLNSELASGVSKLAVDLGMFERLVLDARRSTRHEVAAICGMVGGIRKYRAYFRHIPGESVETQEEARKRCAYRVDGVGELAFEVDSDDRHLPVALASMLGKYVRELAMERQNGFYLDRAPGLPRPSGYHDPVTRRFVDESAPLRKRLGVSASCFERDR